MVENVIAIRETLLSYVDNKDLIDSITNNYGLIDFLLV